MRNTYSGGYAGDWEQIAIATKHAAGWRCVRCHHRFASPDIVELNIEDGAVIMVPDQLAIGAPLFCDDRCDLTKGIHRRVSHLGNSVHERRITLDNRHWLKSLNYGVHHFDGDKNNNRWWNLMALCNSCHLKIQSSVIPERPWLFEHSEWAKPYIGGFYAWWFVGAEPMRDAVEVIPDLFLALGQPWLYPEHAVQAQEWIRTRELTLSVEIQSRPITERSLIRAIDEVGPGG